MEGVKKRRRSTGPRITIELPVEVQKKTFALATSTLQRLADYAAFLSAHHGAAVDEEHVLEGLVAELAKDRAFASWLGGNAGA